MIKELKLSNFRGFDEHIIPLEQFTLLVGKNNAGKSTAVEALRLISIVTQRYQGLSYKPLPSWLERPKRERAVFPATDEFDFNPKSLFHRLGDPPAIISALFTTGHKIEVLIGTDAEVAGVVWNEKGQIITDKASALRTTLPRVSILPQIGPLLREERQLDKEYVKKNIASQRTSLHFRNQLHIMQEHIKNFRTLAEETWPRLRVEELVRTALSLSDYKLDLLVREGDFTAEAGWMGHGLQMWLQTMWFLTHAASADVVVLDEPDVYMHADLQRRLVRLLRSRSHQSVIATHSVEIMSEVEPSQIVVIDRSKRRSGSTDSTPAVQSLLQNIGSIHNIHLARLSAARRIILVEGDDIDYLKPLQNTLFPRSSMPIDTLPNRSLGGWNGWERALGLAMLLKETGDSIHLYCILDSDFHQEEAMLKRYENAKAARINLHIWRRKELENYLLVPAAIQRVIAAGIKKGKVPTIESVEAELDKFAEELRDDVFNAYADEFIRADRSQGLTGANRKARAYLASRYSNFGKRVERAPGKEILHKLSSWAQKNFGVSISAVSLARSINSSEINDELKSVISAIEHCTAFKNTADHHLDS